MKLCQECQFFIVSVAKCGKAPMPVDYVTGKPRGNFDAQVMRESPVTGCGPDAKWFQVIPVSVSA